MDPIKEKFEELKKFAIEQDLEGIACFFVNGGMYGGHNINVVKGQYCHLITAMACILEDIKDMTGMSNRALVNDLRLELRELDKIRMEKRGDK